MNSKKEKGFTLIELLIVIAIVAVLSVVVILTLNPVELLKQARDSNRISDMATLKSAISLYLADGLTTLSSDYTKCFGDVSDTLATPATCDGRYTTSGVLTVTTSSVRNVNGTGWLPVNLTGISSGAPITTLPIDPVHNGHYFYSYIATSSNVTFEINAYMESTKYSNQTNGVVNTDGGSLANMYEVGTYLSF